MSGTGVCRCAGRGQRNCRYGDITLPMDEALILAAVDLGGRSHLEYGLEIPTEKVGTFDTELVEEFFIAFVRNAKLNLHLLQFRGKNSHHHYRRSLQGNSARLSKGSRGARRIMRMKFHPRRGCFDDCDY